MFFLVPLLNDEEDDLESGLQVERTSKQSPPSYDDSVIYKPKNLVKTNIYSRLNFILK